MKARNTSKMLASIVLAILLIATIFSIPVGATSAAASEFSPRVRSQILDSFEDDFSYTERISAHANANSTSGATSENLQSEQPPVDLAASVWYMDVSVVGSGGKIYARVYRVGTMPTHSLTITLYSGDSTSSVTKKVGSVPTSKVGIITAPTQVTHSPSATKYYKIKVTGKIDGKDFLHTTSAALYNKKAVKYPSYTDSKSGKSVTRPSSTIWSRDSSPLPNLTQTQRDKYHTWYEDTYNKGNAINWKDIQIHHIRPRLYGGTHSYSNLIPLPLATHKLYNSWWQAY